MNQWDASALIVAIARDFVAPALLGLGMFVGLLYVAGKVGR